MAAPQRRQALTKAADAERHPAAPPPPAMDPPAPLTLPPGEQGERPPTTMFSVRIPVGLRKRVKLAAIGAGVTVEQWTTRALSQAVEENREAEHGRPTS